MDSISTPKEKVNEQQATREVNEWLDKMGFTEVDLKSEARQADVEKMISGVVSGQIIIDAETDYVTQILQYPAGVVKELVYNPDTDIDAVNAKLKGAKPDMSVLSYYAAAYTNQPSAIIGKLKRGDARTMKALLGFFM